MRLTTTISAGSIITATLALAADQASDPCRITHQDTSFDLRALQRKGRDYNISNPANGETYAINFCGPIKTATWGVRDSELIGSYTENLKGGISLGNFDTKPNITNGHLTFQYTGGSYCPNSNAKRSTLIYLQCDSSWSTPEPSLVSVIEDCFYVFLFMTPHACPTSFVSSVFSSLVVFFTFILVALLVSFASALTYNRYVLHRSGSDSIPSLSKARDLLAGAKDIIVIIGIWLLDQTERLFSIFKSSTSSSSSWGRGGSTDYTRGAWSRSARDGFSHSGLEGGGSLLAGDSDEESDEEDNRPLARGAAVTKPLPREPERSAKEETPTVTGELFKVADDEE